MKVLQSGSDRQFEIGSAASSAAAEECLSTDHLLADLKQHSLSSSAVTGIAQAVRFILNLAGTMALVRLLNPEDFGLVAMVATVMGFMRVFKDLGLSTATVQREGITHAQVSNLFWINTAVSGLTGVCLAAAAPVLAWFYREPRLIGITVALSSGLLISGLTGQHMALLNRQMRFKLIAAIDLGSMLGGLLVGLGMALLGFGYWSLVGMNVATAALALLLTWSVSRWRPQLPTRGCGTRSLLGFGFNLTLAGLAYSVARGTDGLLIGRVYGAGPLGLYSRATALLARPLEQFVSPLDAVFVPALSRLQAQPERYRLLFLRVYESMALLGSVFTGLLLGLAHPLTIVLLGTKWESASPIFAGFAAVAFFAPLCSASTWLLTSQGRGKDSLKASMVVSSTTVVAFLCGMPFGGAGVAIAYSVAGLIVHIPVLYYLAGREGPVRTQDLWARMLRQCPLWAVVCVTSWASWAMFPTAAPWVQLLVGASAGLIAGIAFVCVWVQSRRVALDLIGSMRRFATSRGF